MPRASGNDSCQKVAGKKLSKQTFDIVTALTDESVLETLPEEPLRDKHSLAMEMVYDPRDAARSTG